MAPSILSRVALFGVAARALVHPGPRATDAVIIPDDAQTPKPTAPPALHEFLKRQSNQQVVLVAPDNTCGFVSGQSAAAYTCVASTNLCVFVTALNGGPGAAGCCNESECGFRLSCLDHDQVLSSSLCDSNCQTDSFTEKCTFTSAPYCNTIVFPGSVTDYFCNSLKISTPQLADTTFSGQTGRTFIQTVLTDTSTTTRRTRSSTPQTTSETATGTTTGLPAPTTSTPASSSAPIGAIVGGVVGGVAVLGLVGLGFFFLMRQKKKPSTPETQQFIPPNAGPGPETQQQYNQPPPPSPNSAAVGGVKPGHQSMVSAYSAAPPYGSPPPQQGQPWGQPPPQQGYYNQQPGAYDPNAAAAGMYNQGQYPPDRQSSVSPHYTPQQGYGAPPPQGYGPPQGMQGPPPGVVEAGGQAIDPHRAHEMDATPGQGRTHELA